MAVSIQTLANQLSFSMSLTNHVFFPKVSAAKSPPSLVIRMGGGPRTFPGGVSKWQWKRMQAKKAKQLLKARLCRERQIYEMRKRAELRAAVSELERPWEAVAAVAPTLLSVPADEQLKVLADRFQRPGGFDMWTDDDGPQLFPVPDELPSSRFFPKGVVHSLKPYRRQIPENSADSDSVENLDDDDRWKKNNWKSPQSSSDSSVSAVKKSSANENLSQEDRGRNRWNSQRSSERRFGNRLEPNVGASSPMKSSSKLAGGRRSSGSSGWSTSKSSNSYRQKSIRSGPPGKFSRESENRGSDLKRANDSSSEVYEMSLEQDGSYGFR